MATASARQPARREVVTSVGDGPLVLQISDGRFYLVWGAGLVICLSVFAALGALLLTVLRSARQIDAYAARCQAAAARLATDTDALSYLEAVHAHTTAILATARAIERQDIEIGRRLSGDA